ncbi:MAG TPA: hypothetical protein VMA96_13515 [Solirubrobacteraceae bacterium]|nr:hypothetical protein [Solirubrobacteraceae bacterium]
MSFLEDRDSVAPDLIVPLVGFRQWRMTDVALASMYDGAHWSEGCLTARCDRGHTSDEVPAKECSCGVYAYYDPCPRTASATTPDLVGGAVVIWGRVEAHMYGMRGGRAQVVALELPLSRGRKRRAVLKAADLLGVPAVPHRSLKAVALEHGEVLAPALRPKKTLTRAANVWSRNGPA